MRFDLDNFYSQVRGMLSNYYIRRIIFLVVFIFTSIENK